MAIAYESNISLAFDTLAMKKAAGEYEKVAEDLRLMASKLDTLLQKLVQDGWTTPAGNAFHEMTSTNWKDNIEKYASLLDTLNSILIESAQEYDDLVVNYVQTTKLKL